MMSSVILAFLAGLACVNSETFSGSGILDGAADIVVDIGETETTVKKLIFFPQTDVSLHTKIQKR